MKKFAVLILLFLFLGFSLQVSAVHKMSDKSHLKPCTDPQQPASLRCAPAPTSRFDQQGRLWITWSYGGHVYVSSSDDRGKTLNQSIVVNRIPEPVSARGENRPKIVLDRKGKIYVSWTTPLQKRYTGNVRFSYSNDQGHNFADPITVNDNKDITGHRFEAMAVNDQGVIFMAWLDKRDRLKAARNGEKYRGAALYYSYSDDGGKTFTPNINVMPHTCECCRVVMDIDKDQMPVIMWRNIYNTNTRDHALVKFIDKDKPGKVIRASYDNWQIDACPHHGPAISVTRTEDAKYSDYHLVWFNNAPDRHGIFYSRIIDPNLPYKFIGKKPLSIGDYNKGASHADVLALGKKVWITWKEFDGKADSLKVTMSTDRGQTWNDEKTLAHTEQGSDHPLLIHNKEQVYIQWQTKENGYRLYEVK